MNDRREARRRAERLRRAAEESALEEARDFAAGRSGRRPRALRLIGFPLAVLFVLMIAIVAVPLANPLFPERTIASCTMQDPLRARRDFVPRVASDCGAFTSWGRDVVCSADESLEINLTNGYTYDLVVRGPRIPFLSRPVVVAASVSDEQKRKVIDGTSDGFDLPAGLQGYGDEPSAAVEEIRREFEEQFGVEALHAYDYEQPPFDPECEVGRSLMTAKGIQYVLPDRARVLLTPPEGVAPADPLLPCEGFHCDYRVHQRR